MSDPRAPPGHEEHEDCQQSPRLSCDMINLCNHPSDVMNAHLGRLPKLMRLAMSSPAWVNWSLGKLAMSQ